MITNLSLNTHPDLHLKRHFRMDIPPSPTLAHQSVTINLPPSHFFLQIKPTLAAPLLQRHHKIFATAGISRLHNMRIPHDPQHPIFETRLNPGVNRIEIELIAALSSDAPKGPNGQDVEMEKITIFANLLRN